MAGVVIRQTMRRCVSRAQRSTTVVRCRPGIVMDSEFDAIPDQRCTVSRCTASGTWCGRLAPDNVVVS